MYFLIRRRTKESCINQKKKWIGLGENLQEKPIFNVKNLWVSCKFSLKPIH
jgi:hypothetical protein